MNRLFAVAVILCASLAFAGQDKMMPAEASSAELERIKSLAGTWKGQAPMGPEGQMMAMVVDYRVTAGGSTVVARYNPDSPMEMIDMYHDDESGALTVTHYCMFGNQPQLDLVSADETMMSFSLREGSVAEGAMHMHSLVITFDGDKIVHDWAMFAGGQEQSSGPIALMRVTEPQQ